MSLLKWQIGAVTVTRFVELEAWLPANLLLPDATPESLAPHLDWLSPHFADGDGNIGFAIAGFLVESEGRRILVDTCLGQHVIPVYGGPENRGAGMLDAMQTAGHGPESIDFVLCTHLHVDHVGWNTKPDGDNWVPTFPNARYLFGRTEFDHWRAEVDAGRGDDAATFIDAVMPIVDHNQADYVDTDHRITEEVRLEPTPGHTPGHVAVWIESQGQTAMITGDATHHPVQWAEADWGVPADSDAAGAATTRRRIASAHADNSLLVIGSHYGAPTAGTIARDKTGFRFHAHAVAATTKGQP